MAEESKDNKDKGQDKGPKPQKDQRPKGKEATSILRIAGRDIDGKYEIPYALMQIKGIGYNMAHVLAKEIAKSFNISEDTQIGSLSEEQITSLESAIKNPNKIGVPNFLLNRRRDVDTGQDMHLVGTDLTIRVKQDIDNDIRIQTWRGFRHQYRQKVRGQRTRSTGRTGTTVGVIKKSAAAPAAAGAPTAGEKAAGAQAASAGPRVAGAAPTGGAPAPAKPAAKPAAEEKK